MKQTRRGKNRHFGMKLHIGTDGQGLVHSVRATHAGAADITHLPVLPHAQDREAYGDHAYWKALEARRVRYRMIRRPVAKTPLSERWKRIHRAHSPTRARGDDAFRVITQLWGFAKTRYRRLAKTLARAQTMLTLANLYHVRRELLPAGARCPL